MILQTAAVAITALMLGGCTKEEEPTLSRPDVGFAPRSGLTGAGQTTVPLLSGGAAPQSLAAPNSMMSADAKAEAQFHARMENNGVLPGQTPAPTITPGVPASAAADAKLAASAPAMSDDPHAGLGIPPAGSTGGRAMPLNAISGDNLTTRGRAAAMNPAVFQMPEVPKTNVQFTTNSFTAANIRFLIPIGWKATPTTSPMRLAQYEIPGAAGAAELIVFYFGPGQGGTAEANVRRWVGLFTNPAGGPPLTEAASLENGPLRIALIRARGTMTPQAMMPGAPAAAPRPDSALFGLVVEGGTQGSLFIRATGPAATIDEQTKNFEFLAQNIREVKPVAAADGGTTAPK